MKRITLLIAVLIIASGCNRQPETFDFTLSGTVTGKESGEFYFFESLRLGDEVLVTFEDHSFEYCGSSPNMYSSMIFKDLSLGSGFQIVIEPGEIILELHWDSLSQGSSVLKGDYNIARYELQQKTNELFPAEVFLAEESRKEIGDWMIENADNFHPVSLLSSWESFDNFMPIDKLGEFVQSVKDENLRNSREFIELHSIWMGKKDHINAVGKKAMDFRLPDREGNLIDFSSLSEGQWTFVEKSGSWCGNTTRNTRSLLPVYEKYREYGLEIVTIVPESSKERWLNWLNEEQFPWPNLVELDADLPEQKISYAQMLFRDGNYLVDETGTVIANDLSAASLKEILMERFEPEAWEEYIRDKWIMPDHIVILDREVPVESFDQLVEIMSGRPFLIDAWATWCAPCLTEFEYNEPLKAFLETVGMEMVYINFDRAEDEAKLIHTIRDENLQGYHVRINPSLRQDLMEMGFRGGLPTYMIVNAQGEMVEPNALRPSMTDRLYSQITNALK